MAGVEIWKHIFGIRGASILSTIVGICLVCWSFFDFWYVGSIISNVMPEHENFGFFLGVSLVAVCAILGAIKGVSSLAWLSTASIPFALIIFAVLVAVVVNHSGGMAVMMQYQPSNQLSFAASINLVVASIFPITGLWSDVTYEAKSLKTVAIAMPIGMLMLAALDIVGVFGFIGMNCHDITAIALQLGGALFYVVNIFVFIAQANTVPSNTHVLATELSDALRIPKKYFVLIQPIIAVIASLIIEYVADISILSNWVSVVGCIFSPIFGITLGEYWVIRKGVLNINKEVPAFYPIAFISALVGVVTALYFTYFNPILPGTIISILVGFIVQIVLRKSFIRQQAVTTDC